MSLCFWGLPFDWLLHKPSHFYLGGLSPIFGEKAPFQLEALLVSIYRVLSTRCLAVTKDVLGPEGRGLGDSLQGLSLKLGNPANSGFPFGCPLNPPEKTHKNKKVQNNDRSLLSDATDMIVLWCTMQAIGTRLLFYHPSQGSPEVP